MIKVDCYDCLHSWYSLKTHLISNRSLRDTELHIANVRHEGHRLYKTIGCLRHIKLIPINFMIISMGWGYVSELMSPTGLLFIVHPSGDTWARRTMVKYYRQRIYPYSSTRTLWQSYKQSSSSKAGRTGEENWFGFPKYLCSYYEMSFNMRKNLTWGERLYIPSEGRRAADFNRP
jgi:hypothetical protein